MTTFNDATIQIAAKAWCNDPGAAAARYGDISNWDTSQVTTMSDLFCTSTHPKCDTFNGTMTHWDTSSVTDMGCKCPPQRLACDFGRTLATHSLAATRTRGSVPRLIRAVYELRRCVGQRCSSERSASTNRSMTSTPRRTSMGSISLSQRWSSRSPCSSTRLCC
mmetsp:Transcript_40628/g.100893  ORF Transcript_40628/g.100893 Transcript_40628/m.100893 type:complete len:164 (+) Transcript_40628:64-555(+)